MAEAKKTSSPAPRKVTTKKNVAPRKRKVVRKKGPSVSASLNKGADLKFNKQPSVNASQAWEGFLNLFATFSNKTQTSVNTFKELADEEIENQNHGHRSAMAATYMELGIGMVLIVIFMVMFPGALEFVVEQFYTAPTMYFCWIMTFVFTIGLYLVLRTLTIVNYEYMNLMEVFRKSRKLSVARRRKIHFTELLPRSQYGVTFDKLDSVFRVAEEHGKVPHEAMADILLTKTTTQDEIPNFLANSMTMIGLIGTIIGLTAATQGMEGLIETIGDYNQLKDSLNTTLQGIGVAFFTTLLGAAGMLTLRYFNIVARKTRLVFLTELEQIVLTEIIPKLPKITYDGTSKK